MNIWKDININYNKPVYLVEVSKTEAIGNNSGTARQKNVLDNPFKTIQEAREYRKNNLPKEDQYIIITKGSVYGNYPRVYN